MLEPEPRTDRPGIARQRRSPRKPESLDHTDAHSGHSDDAERFPKSGRIAAIDYGTVRIGIAICDPDRILASPLEVRHVAGGDADDTYFRDLAKRERIAGFVVGLPIHCDGGESQKSIESRRFARRIADVTDRPVRLFDERFTTAAANERLRHAQHTREGKKKRIDAIAALVLLESFLEADRYLDHLPGQPIDHDPTGGSSIG